MLAKKELRKYIKTLNSEKANLSFEKEDSIILQKLKQTPAFKEANIVLLYYPMKNEVNVLPLIDYCFRNNKKVALPKTYKEKIEFVLIDKNWKDNLVKSVLSTTEPKNGEVVTVFGKKSVVITPSLALGKDNSRLGHGKGYYDKFLNEKRDLIKIGICREHLLFNSLPMSDNDVFLDIVISSNY